MLTLNVTIPVFNEEADLDRSIGALSRHLQSHCPFEYEIVIADNGSNDRTHEIATSLAYQNPRLRVSHLNAKGRGRALRKAWSESAAEVLTYMDVDLSTDLTAFLPLIDAVALRGFDIAIGSRLHPDSHTTRGWRREMLSRCYNRLVRLVCATRFSDAQCGFKALKHDVAERLLPAVEDDDWFFDTELLVIAEKRGYRIFEQPVTWTEDRDSRVTILPTAWADLKGLMRVRHNLRRGRYSAPPRDQTPARAAALSPQDKHL